MAQAFVWLYDNTRRIRSTRSKDAERLRGDYVWADVYKYPAIGRLGLGRRAPKKKTRLVLLSCILKNEVKCIISFAGSWSVGQISGIQSVRFWCG